MKHRGIMPMPTAAHVQSKLTLLLPVLRLLASSRSARPVLRLPRRACKCIVTNVSCAAGQGWALG